MDDEKTYRVACVLPALCCLGIPTLAAGEETFRIGDRVGNFSVISTDGERFTLSELLREYDAVVLNFFFNGCRACEWEGSHLERAYEASRDKIMLLGITPL